MAHNLGRTGLKRRPSAANPMRKFDRLPPELRAWLAQALLPWRPQSVRRAFERALARTRDKARALEALSQAEQHLIEKDAPRVWGNAHPASHRGPRAAGSPRCRTVTAAAGRSG